MANLLEDIQCGGSDTRPPMLDRTDFASSQQRTFLETLAEGNESALHLGPKRARVYADLSPKDKDRYNADIRATNILLQGLPRDIYTNINHYTYAKDIWDNVKMLLEGSELTKEDHESQLFVTAIKLNRGLRDSNYDQLYAYLKQYEAHANENKMMLERFTQLNVDPLALMSNVSHQQVDRIEFRGTMQGKQVQLVIRELRTELGMQIQENEVALDKEQLLFLAGGQDNAVDKDVDEQPVQDLALNVDNMFQADDCDAFDSDVDEAPTTQTMFMENLSSADPVYDEASLSYDSDILSKVPDHDNFQDAICEHHEVHEMHDDVQPNYVVDSHTDYASDSNMISYDQYVKDNAVSVVQNKVVNASLTAELGTYKEQVELYERRAKFELTEREQKIDKQLRIVITDRNIKEENLKRELHSVKMQLNSTINHNKSMVEEVTSLKKDFKQKENKYLEEFLDMKALKEKVEDRLFKQDQSLQKVHMLCKSKPHYDEQKKHDEIERKTIFIAKDNLIADWLSKEVFYLATNSELTVSRFTEMHDAHTVVQARCLELEAELSKLHDKVQKDDHTELVKRFSNLEVNHLNLQLKYQNLKERFRNNTSPPARDAPDFDSKK
ncbi:hypothetical protein Tco_0173778 [Tanacetum coccineum]